MFVEKVPLQQGEIFSLKKVNTNISDYPYHRHKEYELMVVSGVSGKRFVGDKISSFDKHHMVLFGPDIPHKWQFSREYMDSAIWVLKFKDIKNNEIFKTPGSEKVNELFKASKRGVYFPNSVDTEYVIEMLEKMSLLKGINAFAAILQILDYLSSCTGRPIISLSNMLAKQTDREIDRSDKIYNLLLNNYMQDLSLYEVSKMFNLSKAGFCTYYKKSTGKTFSEFLNEIRISQAAQLLLESDKAVSEVAYQVGYKNISYFNRKFKVIKGLIPKDYRKKFKGEIGKRIN